MSITARQTAFERITAAVRAQIPLVRAMEAELGRERAHQLVRAALDKANRASIKAAFGDTHLDVPQLEREFAAYGEGIRYEFEVRERNETSLRIDVHHCDYALFMDSIGARDLGPLLICDSDFAMADQLGITLDRSKTCMKGDGVCNFCYHLQERPAPGDNPAQPPR